MFPFTDVFSDVVVNLFHFYKFILNKLGGNDTKNPHSLSLSRKVHYNESKR